MNESVAVALISGLCVAVPTLVATIINNRASTKLIEYKIAELQQSMGNVTQLIKDVTILQHDQKTIWKNIDQIREELLKNDT